MDEAQPSAVNPRAHVDDTELLYHAVRRAHFTRHSETDVTVSANAYSDPEMKPSVDRAYLRDFEPQRTRFNESDGIVSLITKDVRDINDIFQYTVSGQPTGDPYVYDVIWRPVKDDPSPNVRDNLAHAQIEADRTMNDGTFKGSPALLVKADDSNHRGWKYSEYECFRLASRSPTVALGWHPLWHRCDHPHP